MLTIVLVGCRHESSSVGDVICTANVEFAIEVQVYDQETGYPISCGATSIILDEDDGFQEEVTNPEGEGCNDSRRLVGAAERSGTYSVTVRKSGYVDWTSSNVEVTKNVCHVNTMTLQAYLEK